MPETRRVLPLLLIGLLGGVLVGAFIAALTTRLNGHLDLSSAVGLHLVFWSLYGFLGLVAGAVGASALAFAGTLGTGGRQAVDRCLRFLRPPVSVRWVFAGWALVLGAFFLFGWQTRTLPPVKPKAALPAAELGAEPSPLVLLCIDGADLDQIILPMVEAGELPTFRRLLRRSTWGKLETLTPTLSPIIWTTLVTGQAATAHGIHDFSHLHLPGVDGPVLRYPRHTGSPQGLLALLTKLPGSGVLHSPYTSDLRRVPALWEIVGERYPVGIYRWLITHPVEDVHGFMVPGGLYAGPGKWPPKLRKWLQQTRDTSPETLRANSVHPPDAWDEIPPIQRGRATRRMLQAYLAPEHREEPIDLREPVFRLLRRGLEDPTLRELEALSKKYRPRFVAANFYTVDAFQHRFGTEHTEGGRFSAAVAERYRFTDLQLRRFLATLDSDTNLIIVSDHGFDFAAQHHWQAPPGIFFGLGPAFARGRQVEGLSVFDITPMSLHLLGFPLAEDMPGTATGKYRDALKPQFLRQHPVQTIPTYGTRQLEIAQDEELDETLKKELESLGYL